MINFIASPGPVKEQKHKMSHPWLCFGSQISFNIFLSTKNHLMIVHFVKRSFL